SPAESSSHRESLDPHLPAVKSVKLGPALADEAAELGYARNTRSAVPARARLDAKVPPLPA
ncbi:MAG TPA: hypothetical protein P5305_17450, partial [Rubrivivax sp.]|nr:hypothetical protein [Rubrivivax sp.]